MARKPHHKTYQHLLQYYISLYYLMREINPSIKHNQKKHIESIEKINRSYLKDLNTKYPQWETEETREQLKEEIDFLTRVFTKERAEKAKADELQALRDSMKKPTTKTTTT